jgi:hypothetical protein
MTNRTKGLRKPCQVRYSFIDLYWEVLVINPAT